MEEKQDSKNGQLSIFLAFNGDFWYYIPIHYYDECKPFEEKT